MFDTHIWMPYHELNNNNIVSWLEIEKFSSVGNQLSIMKFFDDEFLLANIFGLQQSFDKEFW